jgi:Glycosyl hydrolase family 26
MFSHMRWSGASRARRASILVILAAVATVVGGLTTTPMANGAANSNPLGVYVGALAPGVTSSFGAAIGQQPAVATDFLDGRTWATLVNEAPTWMSTWSGSGYTMVWSVPMLPDTFSPDANAADTSGSAYGLQQGASGAYNSYFLQLAQEMVAGGQGDSIVRPGWEFNGSWFPWAANGQAAAFVGYWQQIVETMRSVPGGNFKFEWNPNAGDSGVGNLASYYPGSAYVDYIGLDVYDQAWATYTGISSEWNTYLTEPYGLNWLAWFAASQGKPITLPEWGLDPASIANDGGSISEANTEVGGGDDPAFINDMAQWIGQNDVVYASYWDYNASRLSNSSNPNSYAAFEADFGAGSTFPVGPPTTTSTGPTTTAPTSTAPTTTAPTTTAPTTTAPTTTTTTSGGTTSGGTGGSQSTPPPHPTPPSGKPTFSTVRFKQSTSRVVTAKGASFSAIVRTRPPTKAGPAGPVTWTVTGADGTPVPCQASNASRVPASGQTTCTVAPGTLAAADGPYTVSVRYAGGGDVAPSVATRKQRVAKASSLSVVKVTPKVLRGQGVQIIAVVKGNATVGSTPTGKVHFAVRGASGRSLPCQAGSTAPLSSGQATCVVPDNATVQAPYFVKVTYGGDGNFARSASKMRAVPVHGRAVSLSL